MKQIKKKCKCGHQRTDHRSQSTIFRIEQFPNYNYSCDWDYCDCQRWDINY